MAGFRTETAPHRTLQAVARSPFVDKVRDVVGLHLNPPDAAVVLRDGGEVARRIADGLHLGVNDGSLGPSSDLGGCHSPAQNPRNRAAPGWLQKIKVGSTPWGAATGSTIRPLRLSSAVLPGGRTGFRVRFMVLVVLYWKALYP